MAKLLRIEKCEQCGWCSFYDDKCLCVNPHKYFDPEDGIPDWCPLPEAEDGGWVLVGDRRPTERGTYEIAVPPLTHEQHPHILVCEWAPAYGFHSEVCSTTFVYDANVLAWRLWQPLPALPKEATDER